MVDGGMEVEQVRARIHAAHQQVVAGAYDAAITAFTEALPELATQLGDHHPEVEELREDLAAVKEMRGVHVFGQTMGYRHWRDPTRPPEDGVD